MENEQSIKEMVREKYTQIALQTIQPEKSSCCGDICCGDEKSYSVLSDNYENLEGYVKDANLGLGCGLPTNFAEIKEGDTVVDLGSGAGNDVFIARAITGENGKVIGIDMTSEMIAKAKINNSKIGYKNVEFVLGEIENTTLPNDSTDVVISNCVLNLVPNKRNAFKEIYRILKPGAHFSVSDIVLKGELPDSLRRSAEMYAGCVSGAIQLEDYLAIIREVGFENVEVKKISLTNLPDEILKEYLNNEDLQKFKRNEIGIFSVTVNGYKLSN